MKKILLLVSMIFVINVANAKTEYYTSVKIGAGDATIYVHGDTKQSEYLVGVFEEEFGNRYKYDYSGLSLEVSPAVGIDWSFDKMYGTLYQGLHLRLEGEIGYNHYREDGKLKDGYTITDSVTMKYDQMFLLANGYADFRINNIIPYVGLGVGYAFGKEEITIKDKFNRFNEFNDSVDDDGIIYALHIGVGYKYSDIATFDFGYRRVYIPEEDDGLTVFGTVRFGARFRM